MKPVQANRICRNVFPSDGSYPRFFARERDGGVDFFFKTSFWRRAQPLHEEAYAKALGNIARKGRALRTATPALVSGWVLAHLSEKQKFELLNDAVYEPAEIARHLLQVGGEGACREITGLLEDGVRPEVTAAVVSETHKLAQEGNELARKVMLEAADSGLLDAPRKRERIAGPAKGA